MPNPTPDQVRQLVIAARALSDRVDEFDVCDDARAMRREYFDVLAPADTALRAALEPFDAPEFFEENYWTGEPVLVRGDSHD